MLDNEPQNLVMLRRRIHNILVGFAWLSSCAVLDGFLLAYGVMLKLDLVIYLGIGVTVPVLVFFGIEANEYRDLTLNLHLFFPAAEPIPEPIDLGNLQRNIQVAQDYRNGDSFIDIKEKYGFGHVNTSRRALIKGIDDLLRFYHDHDGELTA